MFDHPPVDREAAGRQTAAAGGAPVSSSIPWQDRDRYRSALSAMAETIRAVLFHPADAFSRLRLEGSVWSALGYMLFLGTICTAIAQAMMLAFRVAGAAALGMQWGGLAGQPLSALVIHAAAVVVLMPVVVVINAFIGAAILHLCLIVVGGAHRSFEATFCVLAYSTGSTAVIQLVPLCGMVIGAIWNLVVEIRGIAAAHQTEAWRAALAVFLPMLFCCGLGAAPFALMGLFGLPRALALFAG